MRHKTRKPKRAGGIRDQRRVKNDKATTVSGRVKGGMRARRDEPKLNAAPTRTEL